MTPQVVQEDPAPHPGIRHVRMQVDEVVNHLQGPVQISVLKVVGGNVLKIAGVEVRGRIVFVRGDEFSEMLLVSRVLKVVEAEVEHAHVAPVGDGCVRWFLHDWCARRSGAGTR